MDASRFPASNGARAGSTLRQRAPLGRSNRYGGVRPVDGVSGWDDDRCYLRRQPDPSFT